MYFLPINQIEEVPMKWIDGPNATEMDKVSAYEMDRQIKCHKKGNATEIGNI